MEKNSATTTNVHETTKALYFYASLIVIHSKVPLIVRYYVCTYYYFDKKKYQKYNYIDFHNNRNHQILFVRSNINAVSWAVS